MITMQAAVCTGETGLNSVCSTMRRVCSTEVTAMINTAAPSALASG